MRNNNQINKPTTIICSLGRSGSTFITQFIRKLFKQVHIEGEFGLFNLKHILHHNNIRNIRQLGFKKFTLLKIIKKNDLRYISNQVLAGNMSHFTAAKNINKIRNKIISSNSKNIFIENSYHYYGLLNVIPLVFKNYKIVYIVRDPRNWVRSFINFKGWYHWTDFNVLLKKRITPMTVKDQKFTHLWKEMDQFKKLCWTWNFLNTNILKNINKNSNAKIFIFEKLFSFQNNTFLNFINYITTPPHSHIQLPKNINFLIENALKNKINPPKQYHTPHWKNWNKKQAQYLQKICGDSMETLGYGQEKEWKNLIK